MAEKRDIVKEKLICSVKRRGKDDTKEGVTKTLIIQASPVQEFLHFIIHNQESRVTHSQLSVNFNWLRLSALRIV